MNSRGFLLADALTMVAACTAAAIIILGLSTAAFNDKRLRMQVYEQTEADYRTQINQIEPCQLCTPGTTADSSSSSF